MTKTSAQNLKVKSNLDGITFLINRKTVGAILSESLCLNFHSGCMFPTLKEKK
jgi:hypothetical protein